MKNGDARRLPVVSLGAEYLAIGYLMRRNILAYKAPPHNEGYDLICIHPNPRQVTRRIRVQVKSRYQTDCDRAFPVKEQTFSAFDYLIIVFLNLGYFYRRKPVLEGYREPEFYTFPTDWIRRHHRIVESGWQKVHTRGEALEEFKNEKGFELIAKELGVEYPGVTLRGALASSDALIIPPPKDFDMSQDQKSGAAGDAFGRATAPKIARLLGATMTRPGSNEATTTEGKRVVIKCARQGTSSVGVSLKMLETLDAVVGAFENTDGSFELRSLDAAAFAKYMTPTRSLGPSKGKVGIVPRAIFLTNGHRIGNA